MTKVNKCDKNGQWGEFVPMLNISRVPSVHERRGELAPASSEREVCAALQSKVTTQCRLHSVAHSGS